MKAHKPAICISIVSRDTDDAIEKIRRAEELADILELRLDMMDEISFERILNASSKPFLVTYRTKKEGGFGEPDFSKIVRLLLMADYLRSSFIDVEWTLPLEVKAEIKRGIKNSKIILSKHIRSHTPAPSELEGMMNRMEPYGAHAIKIVTRAVSIKDNLIVLDLIRKAKKRRINIISFCMGEKGILSRVMCGVLGSMMTFCSLDEGQESADGQIPAKEFKKLWEMLW